MTRIGVRTLLTSKVAVGATAVALLGGGAALASPGEDASSTDDPVGEPLAEEPDAEDGVPGQPGLEDAGEAGTLEVVEDVPATQTPGEPDEGSPTAAESLLEEVPAPEDAGEDAGEGWALGRADDDQDTRLQGFCETRREAAEQGLDGGEGVPPLLHRR